MTLMILAGIAGLGLLAGLVYVVGTLDRRDEERRSRDLDQWYAENEVRRGDR